MKSKYVITGFLIATLLFTSLGFSYNAKMEVLNQQIEELEALTDSENIVYVGTVEKSDKLYSNDLIFQDENFEYYVDPINGNVERIDCLDSKEITDGSEAIISSEPNISELEESSKNLFLTHLGNDDNVSLQIDFYSSVGVGYDFEICEVDKQGETGKRAIISYDESGELSIACFYKNEVDVNSFSLTEDQAFEIAQNEIEEKTIGGDLQGNDGVSSVQIKSSSSELRVWDGREFFEFSIIADVEFETRGKIQKEYTIDVDTSTGEILDFVWTLN